MLVACTVLIQTFRFTRSIPQTKAIPNHSSIDSAIKHLSDAVKIQTISTEAGQPIDTTSFLRFKIFLENAYPLIHRNLQRVVINEFSYIYIWKGKNAALSPFMLLAHSDVVPVEKKSENSWQNPPFSGIVKDSAIWGRGANDDKGCLISILEAAENLLKQNLQPERTFYFCFGHTEETSLPNGAPSIVNWLYDNKVKPELILDEGGFITKDNFKELNRPIALLGVSEKGYTSFELSVEKQGGHSSMPGRETAIDILVKAITRIRETQMPASITLPTRLMLEKIGPGLGFTTRMALANQWLFKPLLISQFESSNGTYASIHSTIVPTIIESGVKDNIVPAIAKATINCRILPGESSLDVLSFIKKAINNKEVRINIIKESLAEPTSMTPVESKAFKLIESTCYRTMDNVVPVPFLMIGGTDSRFYRKISNNIINFSPMLDPKGYHGIDEHLTFNDLKRMLLFYELILRT